MPGGSVECAMVNKDTWVSFKAAGWGNNVTVMQPVNNSKDGNMTGQKYSIEGDGYDITVIDDKKHGGMELTTMMKFDRYFMYGIDNVGGKNNSAPECGPGMKDDVCKELTKSDKSCCTHVVMTDGGNGEQTSFYRCMNERIVDAKFAFEIDGMKMSMACSKSGSTYVASAIVASLAALVSMATF